MKRVAAIILLAAAAAEKHASSASVRNGPVELNLTDMSGAKVRLRDYRGKIVVLNFWATWCVPCREEMPLIAETAKDWNSKGVLFIGASLDEKATRNKIPEFLNAYKIDFPVWKGATGDDLSRLGMGDAVPATAFLDEQGAILLRVQGEIHRSELIERLEWLTGGRRKAPSPKPLLRNL